MERRSPSPPRDWAAEIIAAWRETVEGIFKTGDLLLQSHAAHPHGTWKAFVGSKLPFGYDTANRLCNIAKCGFLRNVAHAQLLPISYTTLSELAALTEEEFSVAVQEGFVRSDMNRFDATLLKRRHGTAIGSHSLIAGKSQSRAKKTAHSIVLAQKRKAYLGACEGLENDELKRELALCGQHLTALIAPSDPEQLDHPDA